MEHKEHNAELKTAVNKRFEELNKLIGPNRQQLSTKVSGVHRELLKELSKEKVSAARQNEMMVEISQTEKMAHKQLPFQLAHPATSVTAKPKAVVQPKVEKVAKEKPVKEKEVKTREVKAVAKKAAPKKK